MVLGSKGMRCLGEHASGRKCKRARNGSGTAVLLNKVCQNCGEQRCKAHCRCQRQGTQNAKGRKAARGTVQRSGEPSSVPGVVVPPVGRAAAPSTELLEIGAWYQRCCEDIHAAREVELASYVYDNLDVHKELVKKLRSREPFKLNVYIDREISHQQQKTREQKNKTRRD
jgi:hypothetical protein